MYKGNERTRTVDIYVDGVFATSWTNSGTTLDYEAIALGATGESIELRGVLDDSEWLSIMEVPFIQSVAIFSEVYLILSFVYQTVYLRAALMSCW